MIVFRENRNKTRERKLFFISATPNKVHCCALTSQLGVWISQKLTGLCSTIRLMILRLILLWNVITVLSVQWNNMSVQCKAEQKTPLKLFDGCSRLFQVNQHMKRNYPYIVSIRERDSWWKKNPLGHTVRQNADKSLRDQFWPIHSWLW
jgi:hypothetical protein